MAGKIEFGFNFKSQAQVLKQSTSGLMRIYIFGDFSARDQMAKSEITISSIDIDNFDQVMTKLKPRLKITPECKLCFCELDDFHPENIYMEASVFNELKRLKKELQNPQTAQQAADEIRAIYQAAPEKTPADEEHNQENTTATIKRLLGQPPSNAITNLNDGNALNQYLENLFKPHLIAQTTPENQELIAFIDSVTEGLMQSILHSPEFQKLESIWRSTFDLLFNEETDENQLFYLVDICKQELFDDINNNGIMESSIAKRLINKGIKDLDLQPYTLMIGNYTFSYKEEDIKILSLIAEFSKSFNSSFVSSVDKILIEKFVLAEQTTNQIWTKFRSSIVSEWLALTYPRILLRIPYGAGFEVVEDFPFEEYRETHEHEQLLWGNSAFACARLLIRQYLNPQFEDNYVINDLPAYTYKVDGDLVLQACAEEFMNEQLINKIYAHGIMPFISFRNRNSVRLLGFQSISSRPI